MQDKLIAMDEPAIEDFIDEGPVEDKPSQDPKTLPFIEITHFDETDRPADTYWRPLHNFL